MIYEKLGRERQVRQEDLSACVRNKKTSITEYTREDIVPAVIRPVSRSRIKRCLRRGTPAKRRRRLLTKALLVLITVVFCFSVIDNRLDGVLSAYALKGVKTGAEMILGAQERDGADKPYPWQDGRTIYSLSYSEPNKNDGNISAALMQNQTESQADVQTDAAAEVSLEKSHASVDGEKYCPITELDLSAEKTVSVTNDTRYNPDLETLLGCTPVSLRNLTVSDAPLVLVLHTHGSESYTEYDTMYPQTENTRSGDIEKNVVKAGKELVNTLRQFGIEAVHDTTLHDEASFINAYSSSAKAVKKYLAEYPSIRFVIDLHRDAIIRDDGESIRASAEIAGEKYAQLMLVVGTDARGHNHPDWQENLALALRLQDNISQRYPGLCRSINLRDVPFNQQLSTGYLLVEDGTCANTLSQALLSARALGECLAETVLSASCGT